MIFTFMLLNIWPKLTSVLDVDSSVVDSLWIPDLKDNNGLHFIITRSKDGLRVFNYDSHSKDWTQKLFDPRFSNEQKFNESRHRLKIFTIDKKIIIAFLSFENGFVFLEFNMQSNKIIDLTHDQLFRRPYENLEFGYFYGKESPLGLFALHKTEHVSFHFLLMKSNRMHICAHKETNQQLDKIISCGDLDWKSETTKFHFSDVISNNRTNIICQKNDCISIYNLENIDNRYFMPIKLVELKVSTKNLLKFYFAQLVSNELRESTSNEFKELITLDVNGLRVYKYNIKTKEYGLINYSSNFAAKHGWNKCHTNSVIFSDIDNSGSERLIYTSPLGFQIDKFVLKGSEWLWEPLLSHEFNSNINEKYMLPLGVISKQQSPADVPIIVAKDLIDNKTMFFRLVLVDTQDDQEIEEDQQQIIQLADKIHVYPKLNTAFNSTRAKACLNLSEILNIKSIVDSAVNLTSGAVNLNIPVIKMPFLDEPLVSISYASSNAELNSCLGHYWKLHEEFIFVDSKLNANSNEYFLKIKESIYKLVLKEQLADKAFYSLEISDLKDFNIEYDSKHFKWKITLNETVKTYGGMGKSKLKDNGIKRKTNANNVSFASKWYLTQIKDNKNQINFEYNDQVMLEKITINHGDTHIDFIYESKTKEEINYLNETLQQSETKIEKVLKKISLESLYNYLIIEFNYKLVGHKLRFLDSLAQPDLNMQALKFVYNESNKKLTGLVFPNNSDRLDLVYEDVSLKLVETKFDYLNQQSVPIKSFEFNDRVEITISFDYLILSYVSHTDNLVLNVYNRDNQSMSLKVGAKTNQYKIFAFPFYFMLYLHDLHGENESIYLFHKTLFDSSANRLKQNYLIRNFRCFCFNADRVVVVTNEKELFILEWNKGEKIWSKTFSQRIHDLETVLLSQNEEGTVLVYTDESLSILYRSFNSWLLKPVKFSLSCVRDLRNFLSFFALKSESFKFINKHLKQNIVHFSQNIILLNRIVLNENKIWSQQDCIFLSDMFDILTENQIKSQMSLSKYSTENQIEFIQNEKIKFTLGYYYSSEERKYLVGFRFQQCECRFQQGKKEYTRVYELNKQSIEIRTKDHHDYEVKDSMQTKSFSDEFNQMFLLDLNDFFVTLTNRRVTCGRNVHEFNGSIWIQTQSLSTSAKESIKISDSLSLVKNHNTKMWNLNLNDEFNFDFKTSDLNDILVAYPFYIAYLSRGDNSVWIKSIYKNAIEKEVYLTKADYLIRGSNQYLLAVKELNSYKIRFFLNPIKKTNMENWRVIKRLLKIDNQVYVKRYEYDNRSAVFTEPISYSKFKVYPGDDAKRFGYIEYDLRSNIKYFNSDNKLIKIEKLHHLKDENHVDKKFDFKSSDILRGADGVEIGNFAGLNLEKDQADYFGFEANESNPKWKFAKSDVIRNEWPLFGQAFLRLNRPGASLVRIFNLEEETAIYECSCWIRLLNTSLSSKYNLEDQFKLFRLEILETKRIFYSKIKSQYQDWLFVQILVDLEEINLKKFSIKCELKALNETAFDCDHIRWMPTNSRFQINSYDVASKQISSTMNEINLIKRLMYDAFFQPFCVLNSNNQLIEMHFTSNLSLTKLEASSAHYLTYSDYSFRRWLLLENANDWTRTSQALIHCGNARTSRLTFVNQNLNASSLAIYLRVDLISNQSKLIIQLNLHEIQFDLNELNVNSTTKMKVNSNAFYLILAENQRIVIWRDNQVIIDRKYNLAKHSGGLSFRAFDSLTISNILVLNEPNVQVLHFNSVNQLKQQIQLVSEQEIVVTQKIYDELERQVALTKPTRISLKNNEQSLVCRYDLVVDVNSFLKTNKLVGLVSDLNAQDDGYCYTRNVFSNDTLSNIERENVSGKLYAIRRDENESIENKSYKYVEQLFPIEDGFTHKTSELARGNKTIEFYDEYENLVGVFKHTLDYNDLLTTYEYDARNNLIRILPPRFHAHSDVLTLEQCGSTYKQLKDFWSSSSLVSRLRKQFETYFIYDTVHDILIESNTPETRKIFIYSDQQLLRFILKFHDDQQVDSVEYFNYNNRGELCEKGYSENRSLFNSDVLKSLKNVYVTKTLADGLVSLHVASTSNSIEANCNGKCVTSQVKNSLNEFVCQEENCFSSNGNLMRQEATLISSDAYYLFRLEKAYSLPGRLHSIKYPFLFEDKMLQIVYDYNKLELVSAIRINSKLFVQFDYTASGALSQEIYSDFARNYVYNSVGFLSGINDCFWQEEISYFQNGYRDTRYYDDTITKCEFNSKWLTKCDPRLLGLSEDDLLSCFEGIERDEAQYLIQLLTKNNYLNEANQVIKDFCSWDAVKFIPLQFSGESALWKLSELLNSFFPNHKYGYKFSYGSHSELVDGKYFIGDSQANEVISSNSFASDKVSANVSRSIWKVLVENEFIVPLSCETTGSSVEEGRVNINSWVDMNGLKDFLRDSKYKETYVNKLSVILQEYFMSDKFLDRDTFSEMFKNWHITCESYSINRAQDNLDIGKQFWQILYQNNYIPIQNKPFALFKQKFSSCLKENNLNGYAPHIVRVLCRASQHQIGESSCDLRCFEIDENGNHQLFWRGLKRYSLNYKENSNQIDFLRRSFKSYKLEHDSLGNVTKAEHKNIEKIIYDKCSNRAIRFVLKSGTRVDLAYNASSERVYKCVMNSSNVKLKEIFYVRDQKGRCLVEKEIFYNEMNGQIETEYSTAYIYGPRSLLTFIRDDQVYNVITDHQYSTRVVVKNGEAVAAFDYYPYGSVLRKYGLDSVNVRYLYTGQEWDEELKLYNYHARFYDPDIGRFYQVDEKEQYASPYKYAANSPISMIDPDGNLAMLVPIVLGLAGAYLGGAAANDDWCIWKWEFDKVRTYLGIFGGGISGFLLPLGFYSSASAIAGYFSFSFSTSCLLTAGLGAVGTYIGMACFSGTFNPAEWEWRRPALWNSAFHGFSTGVQLPSAMFEWHRCLEKYGSKFFFESVGLAAGMAYMGAASANGSFNPANWKLNLATFVGALNGAYTGFFLASNMISIWKANSEFIKLFAWGKYLIVGSSIAMPVIFLVALKQETSMSIVELLQTPNTYETIMSGLIMGLTLPNLLMKTLPEAFKKYSVGLITETLEETKKIVQPQIDEACEKALEDREVVRKFLEKLAYDLLDEFTASTIEANNNMPSVELNNLIELAKEDIKNNGRIENPQIFEKKVINELIDKIKTNGNLSNTDKQHAIKNYKDLLRKFGEYRSKPKIYDDHAISVVRVQKANNGEEIIIATSSTKEIYGIIKPDGTIDKTVSFEPKLINEYKKISPENRLAFDAEAIKTASGKNNDPKNCGEFRAIHIIAAKRGYNESDIVSMSAFKGNKSLESLGRCGNCRKTFEKINILKIPTDCHHANSHFNNQIRIASWESVSFLMTHAKYDCNKLFLFENRGFSTINNFNIQLSKMKRKNKKKLV